MTALTTDLETPAVIVHLDVMEDNIRRVQAHLDRHRVANRPHIKTHKIPAIGKMQMAAGAVGITCQKLGEVEVFAAAGVADDVLLTYDILGPAKTERLMALAARVPRLTVVLDNEVVAGELAEAARRAQRTLPFLIECDTGFRRTWEQCAMRVRATVVSRPTDDRGVLDAGSKVLTSDLYHMKGYGHLVEYPEAQVAHLSEEHAVVDFSACAERPKVGEVVSVVPNHCCVVTNMVDEVYGVRHGGVEVTWPVAARGRVR